MLDEVTAALRSRCDAAGLDIVHPFCIDWFNDGVEPALRLPDGGRRGALGFVIGNTRRLWSVFASAVRADPALLETEHPLDAFVERVLTDAAAKSIVDRHVVLFAHRMTPAPIAIQRVAHASGLAHLSPSRLSIHPVHGPWWALRAVVAVEADGPSGARPRAPDPCTPCSKPCLAALERAIALTDVSVPGEVESQWKAWAEVREVCPEGKPSHYGDDQLHYHYTKDRSHLRLLLR
jgi:cyanocobalamin reductase (cyanide-eliminating) / alkylcobalamin dealkylase